jgi:inner membrane protein
MATVLSHAAVAVTLGKACPGDTLDSQALFLGAFCSVIPDIDVVGFAFGIRYGALWGHRGMTHSILFALLLSAAVTTMFYSKEARAVIGRMFLYFFVCSVSHGILDAMTNGGMGIAFLAPFSAQRYFFRFRPIAVSPIGNRFFSHSGWIVLLSEAKWIWLPCAVLLSVVYGVTAFRANKRAEGD